MIKKITELSFLFILITFFIGCSLKYLPVKTENVGISEDYAIIKAENFNLIVQNRYWNKEPLNLNDYFTTFYVSIKNKSDDKNTILPQDITLLDESGNQYDPVSLSEVENILLPNEIRFRDIYNTDHMQLQILENWREAKKNLMQLSFHFGQIFPYAKKSGFVYFSRLPSSNKECKIIYKDQEILFFRNDRKEKK